MYVCCCFTECKYKGRTALFFFTRHAIHNGMNGVVENGIRGRVKVKVTDKREFYD